MQTSGKPKVLILCTGNSCRSHMAEAILRKEAGDIVDVFSAGSNPAGYVHSMAIEALKELGIDTSGHTSKHLDQFLNAGIDTVITVCDNANESCPVFPGSTKVTHVGFDDPPRLARDAAAEKEALYHYRRVRDEIRAFVETLPEALSS